MQRRYPQFNFDGVGWGLLEPQHGVVMARRAVQAVVAAAVAEGVTYLQASVNTPARKGNLPAIETSGEEVQQLAAEFVSGGMRRTEFSRSRGLSFGTLDRHLKKQRWKEKEWRSLFGRPVGAGGFGGQKIADAERTELWAGRGAFFRAPDRATS